MNTKKIISILTTLCLIVSCFTGMVSVSAEDAVLESISAETVCEAILSTDSTINVTATQEDGYVGVTITSELLKNHENGEGTLGYWAGFAVAAPEGATHLKYAFGTSDEITLGEAYALTDEDVVTTDGKKGIAFYADAASNDAKTYAKLQWFSDETTAMSAETTFVMNLDGIVLDGVEKEEIFIDALDKKASFVDLVGVEEGDDVSVNFSKIKMEYNEYTAPEYITEFDVANVADFDSDAAVYDEGTYRVELKNENEICITMKDLVMHTNGNDDEGHWTGFSVKVPEGAKSLVYCKSFGNNSYDYQTIEFTDDETEVSFYINVTDCATYEWLQLQWSDENGSRISNLEWYEINLSDVEIAAEKEVTFETANVCDSFPGENAPAKVYEEYDVEVDADTISISMTDLALHRNANKVPGYWTGFTVNAPEGTKYLVYDKNFGDSYSDIITFEDGQTSESFYFDIMGYYSGDKRTIRLQFLDENELPITRGMSYEIDDSDVQIKYPEENTIEKANIVDQANLDESVYDENSYDVALRGSIIELSATNLKTHTNGNGDEGHWIGFKVNAPDGATHYTYVFGENEVDTPVALEDGETSVSFYVNASSPDAKDYLEIRWYCDEDEPESYPYTHAYDYTSYYIDLTNVDIADNADVDVTAANVVNQNAPETAPYIEAPTVTVEDGTIKLAVEGLKTHFNGNGDLGAWVGASISRPNGAEYVKYVFENEYDAWWGSADYVSADEVADADAISFYVDAYDKSPKNTIMLQWFDENEVAITNILTYELDLSDVDYLLADEAEVSFEKANIVDQDDPDEPAYVDKYDVELDNDTIKLSADCIKRHANAEGNYGAWIGFKASVEGAKYLKYVFENDSWYYDWYNAEQIEISVSESFYVNAADVYSKNIVMLQWFDENGNALTNVNTYKIDIEKVTTEDTFPVLFSNIELIGEDARLYNLDSDECVDDVSNTEYVYVRTFADNGTVKLNVNGTDESNGGNVFYRDENKTVTLTTIPNSGYVFNGWYDWDGNNVSNAASYEITLDDCYEILANFKTAPTSRPPGGSASNKFTVKFETNGGNEIAKLEVKKGELLAKPADPTKSGYVFDGWYTDKALTAKYDFATPVNKSFTLYAKWVKEDVLAKFTDLDKAAWYYDYVKAIVEKGLMNGMSDTEFAPNVTLTRGMFVTILYRVEGEPSVEGGVQFTDVAAGQYYENAVKWASANGIVEGISETEFAPDVEVTREQMAAMIARFADYKKMEVSADSDVNYTDNDMISEYAKDSVVVTNKLGILIGNDDGSFAPQRNATRAEAAALFVRLLGVLEK